MSADNIEAIILDAAPESSTEVVIEQTPPAKAPKKRVKKADKVEVKVEEVKPEPIIVTEPVAEPVTEPVTEVKPKAKRTTRPTKKNVEIEQTNVSPAEPPAAEQPPFNPPIQITPEMQEELFRNWITVQNNNKKIIKQQKYKNMMAQAF